MAHTLLKSNISIGQDNAQRVIDLLRTIPFLQTKEFPREEKVNDQQNEEEKEEEEEENLDEDQDNDDDNSEDENEDDDQNQDQDEKEDDSQNQDDYPYLKWKEIDAKRRQYGEEWRRCKDEEEQKSQAKQDETVAQQVQPLKAEISDKDEI